MPKNHVLRQRAKERDLDNARREAKKLQRQYGTAEHEFEQFAQTAIENGMDPKEVAQSLEEFRAFQRDIKHIADNNNVIFNYFSSSATDFRPGGLDARAKMSKQLEQMHKLKMQETHAEFLRDDHKIQLFYTSEGVDVHIWYHIATLLRCPFPKMQEYNLNMIQDVIYMTTYKELEGQLLQLHERVIAEDSQPLKFLMNTQNVRVIPLTRELFRRFAGSVGTMIHVGPDHRNLFSKDMSALFFVRNGPISDSFSLKFYVWAASKESRKLLRWSCNACGKTRVNVDVEKFLCCNQCKRVYYCSPECQANHWQAHKIICREIGREVGDL